MTTGDPTLDGFISWIQSGAGLSSSYAVAGIAAIVYFLAIPALTLIFARFNKPFDGVQKRDAVVATGVGVAAFINMFNPTKLPLSQIITVGAMGAIMAMGYHKYAQTANANANTNPQQQSVNTSVPYQQQLVATRTPPPVDLGD